LKYDVTTSRDISTHDIFGKRLHTYTIKDAIGDGNVLGFDVTYFKPHWVVENAESDFSEQESCVEMSLDVVTSLISSL
jgi:type I restriction enzyme R subunit